MRQGCSAWLEIPLIKTEPRYKVMEREKNKTEPWIPAVTTGGWGVRICILSDKHTVGLPD